MGEAIKARRGGLVKVKYTNHTPTHTILSGKVKLGKFSSRPRTTYSVGSAKNSSYALFVGGMSGNTYSNTADAYNSSLSRTTAANLRTARSETAGATVGNYAIFGGGEVGADSSYYPIGTDSVDAYNRNLVHSAAPNLYEAAAHISAASVGNYALIGGGGNRYVTDRMNTYNADLIRSSATRLNGNGMASMGATSIGSYAIFAGGYADYARATVETYNASLTHSTAPSLSESKYYPAATTVGSYAIIGGGAYERGSVFNNLVSVDAYNVNTGLTRTTIQNLAENTFQPVGVTVGGHALIGQFVLSSYNASLVFSKLDFLAHSCFRFDGCSIGEYAIFTSGDAFTPEKLTILPATAGSKYKFDSDTAEKTVSKNGELQVPVPVTGYIKYKPGKVG